MLKKEESETTTELKIRKQNALDKYFQNIKELESYLFQEKTLDKVPLEWVKYLPEKGIGVIKLNLNTRVVTQVGGLRITKFEMLQPAPKYNCLCYPGGSRKNQTCDTYRMLFAITPETAKNIKENPSSFYVSFTYSLAQNLTFDGSPTSMRIKKVFLHDNSGEILSKLAPCY